MIVGYHCTTPRKLARYHATGQILAPVRFWLSPALAVAWAKRTARSIILRVHVAEDRAWPMHDHFGGWFTLHPVARFDVLVTGIEPGRGPKATWRDEARAVLAEART